MKIKYNIVKSSLIFTYTNLIRYNNKSHYFKVKLVKQGKWTENVSNKKKRWRNERIGLGTTTVVYFDFP